MTKNPTPHSIEYSHIDHSHCWTEKAPPCGQRIEHYKCCICEELNPKVTTVAQEAREEMFRKACCARGDIRNPQSFKDSEVIIEALSHTDDKTLTL